MKRLLFAAALITLLAPAALPGKAGAANTNAKLDIYPKDCVFEQVNNGTNQITFLTPAECGQAVTIIDPEPDTQTLAPVALSNPTEEQATEEEPGPSAVEVFLSQIAPMFTLALTAAVPWISVSSIGGGLLVSLAVDPKSLAPMSMFRFVLSFIFGR